MSERLVAVVGKRGLAARLGGDEFTVFASLVPRAVISRCSGSASEDFKRPLQVDDREFSWV